MRKFPTAALARKKSDNQCSDQDRRQIDEIFEKIEDATNDGEYKIVIYFTISAKVRRLVQDLGYTIFDESNQRDGSQFRITW